MLKLKLFTAAPRFVVILLCAAFLGNCKNTHSLGNQKVAQDKDYIEENMMRYNNLTEKDKIHIFKELLKIYDTMRTSGDFNGQQINYPMLIFNKEKEMYEMGNYDASYYLPLFSRLSALGKDFPIFIGEVWVKIRIDMLTYFVQNKNTMDFREAELWQHSLYFFFNDIFDAKCIEMDNSLLSKAGIYWDENNKCYLLLKPLLMAQ